MRRLTNALLLVLVVILGLWIGSRFFKGKQAVYYAPEDYTEKVEGLDGIKVR
jgi:hypothetical protein